MRLFRLVTVRALLELGKLDRKVCASIPLASVGDPSFGYAHGFVWLLSVRLSSRDVRAIRRADATS